MIDKIVFDTNVPVGMKLKFPNGREVESRVNGETQVMFTTTENRSFFVSLGASTNIHNQIAEQGIKPGDPIEITKAEVRGAAGRKLTQWQVRRVIAEEGPQQDGTFVARLSDALRVKRVAAASALTPAPVSAAASQPHNSNVNGNSNKNGSNGHQAPPPDASQQPAHAHLPWALHLLNTTNALTDVYGTALAYANARHGGLVKGEDVRALMATAFISQTKNGGPNVA